MSQASGDSQQQQITRLLLDWRGGDRHALDALTPLVYDELRRLAAGGPAPDGRLEHGGSNRLCSVSNVRCARSNGPARAGKWSGIDLAVVRNILPFSVVLVNNGQNRILQTTVGFEFQDEKDQLHREIFNLTAFNRGLPGQIPQGGARLIVPQRGLNVHFAGIEGGNVNAESIRAYSDVIAKIETDFGKAKSLSAFIDSVTIESVGLVGPDLVGVRDHGQDRKTM